MEAPPPKTPPLPSERSPSKRHFGFEQAVDISWLLTMPITMLVMVLVVIWLGVTTR